MKALNDKKLEDQLFIPCCTFGVYRLTSTFLDRIKEFNDMNCMKQIMFLIQYFYEERLNQKMSVYQLIMTHICWKIINYREI